MDGVGVDDNTMRDLMRQVVDRVYTFEVRAKDPGFLERIERWAQMASGWDEPKLDQSFMPALRVANRRAKRSAE